MLSSVEKEIQKPSPANNAILEILSLIHSTPKYGIKTYALWLGKSQAAILENKKLNASFRGKLSCYKTEQIVTEIERLLRLDWLEIVTVGSHHLPVLKLTQKGIRTLESLQRKQNEAGAIQILEKPPQEKAIAYPKVDNYYELLQDIQNGKRQAWISFLKQDKIVSEIDLWETSRIESLRLILEEKIPGWQIPLRWEIAMHPKKNKPLEIFL